MNDEGKPLRPSPRLAAVNEVLSHQVEAQPSDQDPGAGRKPPLPDNFPVQPLGVSGSDCHYLDAVGQYQVLGPREHSRNHLVNLTAPAEKVLYDHWGRHDREGQVNGIHADRAAEAFMAACKIKGPFDPAERVRGRGAWRGGKGELILHCGDAVYIGGRWLKPGAHEGFVYPGAAPSPRPAEDWQPGGPKGPAEKLLGLLKTWSWSRPDLDPHLLLGWSCAAMLGGALVWRPMVWVTGDRGTGKSTMHRAIQLVMGGSILTVSDATAAGIWQKTGHASLPVAFDEIEPDADNRQNQNIIKLARQAASGGIVLRGGADHKGSEFVARSCFLFSSILIPPLLSQDRSRMAMLELGALATARPVELDPETLGGLGAAIRRRLVSAWSRFDGTLEAYRMALAGKGHGGRSADQFGTLLACADLALHDREPSGDDLDVWSEHLKIEQSGAAGDFDEDADHERCLAHLLTMPIDAYRGGKRENLATFIARAVGKVDGDQAEAREVLLTHGLRLVTHGENQFLAVANAHQALAHMFHATHWAARSGAAGVWAQALKRLPGAKAPPRPLRFGGPQSRCVLVPLEHALDPSGRPLAPFLPFDRIDDAP